MSNLPLIEPVEVTVAPLDTDATHWRANAREPVKAVARSTEVSFDAQVYWTNRRAAQADRAGEVGAASGYLITRQWILDEAGYVPQTGDLVKVIGTRTGLRLYISAFSDAGHLDGGNTMVHLDFSAQKPAKGA